MRQKMFLPSNFSLEVGGMSVLDADWGLTTGDSPSQQAVTKIPGIHKVGDITLKRGVVNAALGKVKFGDITLKKGYVGSTLPNDWTKIVPGGPGVLILGGLTMTPAGQVDLHTWGRIGIRKNARLVYAGTVGQPAKAWNVSLATPLLDAASGDIAMETITIAHEGLRPE